MNDPNNQQQFAVSLSSDRDGFLRRCCPKCGRDFKTEINAADLQWELEAQCRRMAVEVGEESSTEPAQLRCPYCAHVAPPSEMHTEETVGARSRRAPILEDAHEGTACKVRGHNSSAESAKPVPSIAAWIVMSMSSMTAKYRAFATDRPQGRRVTSPSDRCSSCPIRP
jgi:hypothetical protein